MMIPNYNMENKQSSRPPTSNYGFTQPAFPKKRTGGKERDQLMDDDSSRVFFINQGFDHCSN